MRYPCLILKSMCKTEIHVEIEQEGRNVYGEPLEPVIWDGYVTIRTAVRQN